MTFYPTSKKTTSNVSRMHENNFSLKPPTLIILRKKNHIYLYKNLSQKQNHSLKVQNLVKRLPLLTTPTSYILVLIDLNTILMKAKFDVKDFKMDSIHLP